jgi:hypothetical protein
LYGEQKVCEIDNCSYTVRGAQKWWGKLTESVNSVVDFETIAYVPLLKKKYGQGWFGAHDPFENGSWGELFDGVKEHWITQADGNSLNFLTHTLKIM